MLVDALEKKPASTLSQYSQTVPHSTRGPTFRIWLATVGEPLPVFDGDNPRLLRAGALARRLTARGHEVLWWTSSFDHYGKRQRTTVDTSVPWEGGTMRLLHSAGYRRNVSLRRFIEHAGVARRFAAQAPRQPCPDVILASLPTIELAREAVRFGLAQHVPVLLDVRDLWPDVMIDVLPPSLRWLSRLLLAGQLRDARWALRHCTGIVGISPGYLAWGLAHAARERRASDAMLPLGYVAPVMKNNSDSNLHEQMRSLGVDTGRRLCWYVGSFGRQYDLAPVLEAAAALHNSGRADIQFVISGDGELGERWRQMAQGLLNVVFTGWVGADEINWLRQRAAVGLQPYVAGAPQGLANKLFEYLSAGIPVVSSLEGENEKLIAEHRCGLTYRAGDAADFQAKLQQMLDDDGERHAMGLRGKRLFETQFDGAAVFDALAAHLEAVAAGRQLVTRTAP